MLERACNAAPRTTWFREVVRFVDFEIDYLPIEDPLLLTVAETIEKRIQQVGIAGAGFEKEAHDVIELLQNADATPFEKGLKATGFLARR